MRGLEAVCDEFLNGRPARASSPAGTRLLRIVDRRPVDLDRVEVEQSVLVCTEASNVEAVGTAFGSVDTLTRLPVGQPVPVADPLRDERGHWLSRLLTSPVNVRPTGRLLGPACATALAQLADDDAADRDNDRAPQADRDARQIQQAVQEAKVAAEGTGAIV